VNQSKLIEAKLIEAKLIEVKLNEVKLNEANSSKRVVLVRHGAVEVSYKAICYGRQDVPLCTTWKSNARELITALAAFRPTTMVHSGRVRTRWLADEVANVSTVRDGSCTPVIEDHRLLERDYGDWEGLTWDEVFNENRESFHDLIHKPDTYRPPGGETTSEVQERVYEWFIEQTRAKHSLSVNADRREVVMAISHSGPAAALAGKLLGLPADQWNEWMLGYGNAIVMDVDMANSVFQVTRWDLTS